MAKPYCTEADVRTKIKDLEKREIASDIIISAIEDADNLIEAYLCRYYDPTGFSSSVGVIKTISKIISAAIVTGTNYGDFDQSASTWESKQYNWAMNKLKLIQDGTMSLPGLSRISC